MKQTMGFFLKRLSFAIVLGLVSLGGSRAEEIRMIIPYIPPHFDSAGDGRIGDVIRASLQACGHSVSFTSVPFGRHWKDYTNHEAYDALATAEADQTFPGTSTLPFMNLQDGATVLSSSGLESIVDVEGLAGMRIVAFPNADMILGIEATIPRFASFKTRSNRFDQIRPLFAGRADAVLADGLITAHFISVLRDKAAAGQEPDIDPAQSVVFRRIFKPGPQRLYFRDEAIARDFDRCFRELLESGEVVRMTKPYLDRYREIIAGQYPDY